MKPKTGYLYKLKSESLEETIGHYGLNVIGLTHSTVKQAIKQHQHDEAEGIIPAEEGIDIYSVTFTLKKVSNESKS